MVKETASEGGEKKKKQSIAVSQRDHRRISMWRQWSKYCKYYYHYVEHFEAFEMTISHDHLELSPSLGRFPRLLNQIIHKAALTGSIWMSQKRPQ